MIKKVEKAYKKRKKGGKRGGKESWRGGRILEFQEDSRRRSRRII